MTYLQELDSLARQYGNARGVTAATVVEHADECSSLFATIANKAGVQDATQLSLKSFGAFLSHLPGVQVVRGGNKKIGHYSVEVPDPALRSRGSVDNAGGVEIADTLLGAVAPGEYRRGDKVIGESIPSAAHGVNIKVDAERSRVNIKVDEKGAVAPGVCRKYDSEESVGVARVAQHRQAGQQFTAREPVAETNAECKYSCAGYTRNIDGGDTSSKAPCHVENDKGTKRPFDPGSKSTNSDNPRVNPALHVPQAPKGYHLRGVSTLLDGDGKPVQQWVKTTQDPDGNRLEALLEELLQLPAGYNEVHEPKPAPTHLDADLLCLIPLGDPHLGLRVWSEEAGSDYDINIAERAHVDAIRKLISVVPSAKQALIVSLGDLLHCDNNSARTTRSGNALDVDTRWQKVMRVGLRMLRAMIDLSLTKFETVRIVCEQGNHDDLSSIMMAMMLEAFYSKDPRVSVDTSPAPFHYYRFGKNLIGTTHGAETKPEQLPMIMAADRPEDWGSTEFRRWLCGHVHHESVREFPGVTAEWFRTLAPRDAWANAKGYRAGRDMRCDVLHREHGFVSRYAIGINQLDVA